MKERIPSETVNHIIDSVLNNVQLLETLQSKRISMECGNDHLAPIESYTLRLSRHYKQASSAQSLTTVHSLWLRIQACLLEWRSLLQIRRNYPRFHGRSKYHGKSVQSYSVHLVCDDGREIFAVLEQVPQSE